MAAVVKASGFDVTEVVSGNARGIDRCGEGYGYENDLDVKLVPINPTMDGKAAFIVRNQLMVQRAQALIVIGSDLPAEVRHLIVLMRRANKPVYQHRSGLRVADGKI